MVLSRRPISHKAGAGGNWTLPGTRVKLLVFALVFAVVMHRADTFFALLWQYRQPWLGPCKEGKGCHILDGGNVVPLIARKIMRIF